MTEKDLFKRGFKKVELDEGEFCYYKDYKNVGYVIEVYSDMNRFSIADLEGSIKTRMPSLSLLPGIDNYLTVNEREIKNIRIRTEKFMRF